MRFFQQLSVMPRRQGRLVLVVFLFDFMVFGHGLLLMLNSPERGDLVLLGSVVVAAAVLVGIAAVVRLVRWVGRGCPQPPPHLPVPGPLGAEGSHLTVHILPILLFSDELKDTSH